MAVQFQGINGDILTDAALTGIKRKADAALKFEMMQRQHDLDIKKIAFEHEQKRATHEFRKTGMTPEMNNKANQINDLVKEMGGNK